MRNLLHTTAAEALLSAPEVSALDDWLDNIRVDADTPLNGKRLAGMLQQSGQLLEHKLQKQDLKAIMLALGNGQVATTPHLTRLLREIGNNASSRIESTQALNVLAHVHNDPQRIELPMLVNQQMVNVQLSLQQQEQAATGSHGQQKESPAYKVLIALEMTRLGKLRVDASISEHAVHARIHHVSAQARELIQTHIDRLKDRLLNLGFTQVYLITTQAQPDQATQQRFEQLEQMKPVSSSLLDIRI